MRVACNLSRLTGSTNILPVERFTTLEYTDLLELRITQFEADASNTIVLQGTWKMQPVSGKETSDHYFRIAVPMKSPSLMMKDRVTAMNQALARLARDIAVTKLTSSSCPPHPETPVSFTTLPDQYRVLRMDCVHLAVQDIDLLA